MFRKISLKIFLSVFICCFLTLVNAQDLPNAQIRGDSKVKLISANGDSSGLAKLENVLTWNNVGGKPTALSQFVNDLGLNAMYHPLENQRLSTTNSPTFTGLTSSSPTVSEILLEGTGSSNFSGGSFLFRAGEVQAGDQFGQITMAAHRGTTGTASFVFQRRTRTNDYTGEILSYSDGDGWDFRTAENRTASVTSSKFRLNNIGAFVGNRLGINVVPDYRFDLLGTHNDAQFRLFSAGGGTSATEATLFMWASEPNLTFTGVGISNNISNNGVGNGLNRLNTNVGASYMRLLENGIEFATYNNAGTKSLPFILSGASAEFTAPLTVSNASASSHAINLSQLQSSVSGTTNYVPVFTGTNAIGNSSFLATNVALKNVDNNFSTNQTVPNASANDHALNRITADGRFLGLTATAANSNTIRGLDTNVIAQRNAVNTFTQKNTFTNQTVFSGQIYTDNVPDFNPYVDGTDKIYVMKGDGQMRTKNIRDIINDVSVNDTFALTGTTGGVFNLTSTATTTVDLGIYTNSISTNSVIEFRLASGNPFYDNQQITVMSSKSMTCGQGVKIRLADNGGTSLVQIANDILTLLTEEYEFAENPIGKFTIVFQYSKKRNIWRIVNFKSWNDL